MRRLSFILLCTVTLGGAGQAPPFDMSAIPDAAAARQHGLNRCQAMPAATIRAGVECSLAAHRLYAVTEKLRDMALFQTYAASVRRAASDADAGGITVAQAQKNVAAARADYEGKVARQYADYHARNVAPAASPPFDHAALPAASAVLDRAVQSCGSWASRETVAAHAACIRAAEEKFLLAIKLRDRDRYYGYASVFMVDAADAQDGRRAPASLAERRQTLWTDFRAAMEGAYQALQHRTGAP